MKRISLFLFLGVLSACSTMVPKTEELKASPKCTVWKDGPLGSKTVLEVEGEVAKQKMTCWILGMFACSYTDYTFKDNGVEIKSSLPPADKTIGTLNGNKMTVSVAGVTVEPFELKDDRADYVLQGLVGPKQNMTVEFNHSCTKKQAALGLMTMLGK